GVPGLRLQPGRGPAGGQFQRGPGKPALLWADYDRGTLHSAGAGAVAARGAALPGDEATRPGGAARRRGLRDGRARGTPGLHHLERPGARRCGMNDAAEIIRALDLRPQPLEGGYYCETYRSPDRLPRAALPAGYAGDKTA